MGQVNIWLHFLRLPAFEHKLHWLQIVVPELEDCDFVVRVQLDHELSSAGKVNRMLKLALTDAGKDLVDHYLLIERIVPQHIHLEILAIMKQWSLCGAFYDIVGGFVGV